jgi:photosynthetic reaction center cytochrome c subunit
MLPKWYDKWNKENPVDIYGPVIFVGTIGAAVFVAAALVSLGQPYNSESLQTGPRGTGMSVPEFDSDRFTPDPTIEGYVRSDPIPPQGGEQMAIDVYENVPPALSEVTVENYDRLLTAMRSWTGIPDLMEDADNYQTQVAWTMVEMTQSINENWYGHIAAQQEVGVTCYTCHRGQPVPSEIWFRIAPNNDATAGWAAIQNRATLRSQYTSLPVDALEHFFIDYGQINVHNLESRVAENPSDPGVQTWQDTERTYALMNYVSNALGVNCVFCHNSRAFYDVEQVTPQWATEQLGIGMVQEINNDYLIPLADVYPEERLGPIHGDAPKAACKTCHKGYQQPLNGLVMYPDWPELMTTGTPVYEAASN